MGIKHAFIKDSILKHNINKFISDRYKQAGITRVDVQATPMLTRIIVYCKYPQRVLSRGLEQTKQQISKLFNVQNPQIVAIQIQNERLEPKLVAEFLARKLELGGNPRKLAESMVRSIIMNGAIGAEIRFSGKLKAKNAESTSIVKRAGYLPKAGYPVNYLLHAKAVANTKYGIIGIKVTITPADIKLPDKEIRQVELPKNIASASNI
ncbi:MAG: 30S ribosomal protein S3 [Candidatus Micrarchaeota archaeon]|nr:MAG: 30S ribosomal protein S3 [Candidatus Micrarchaeota archaeon]